MENDMTSAPRRAARTQLRQRRSWLRAFWLVLPLMAATGAVGLASPAQAQDTLREAAADDFFVGTAVTPDLLNNPTYASIAAAEFSSVTAENHMKWDTVEPSPNSFNFGPGDQVVQFAQQNNQHVYGHTLVWHSQTPQWVQELSGDALRQAMQNHITQTMQHWDLDRWDVVNEAVSDNNGQLRDSFWLQGLGQGYIAEALQAARAADPGATLCLNDYSIDGINAKSDAYFNLVQQLQSQGVPIDCMSFQAHLILGQVPSTMQQNLQRFANLGLEVWITELDIRIPEPVDQQELQQQANEYAQVFQSCQQVSACAGVTTWGLHDAQSWVDDTFPEFDAPLLWDDNFNRKPAYFSVLEQLGGQPDDDDPPPATEDCQVTYEASNWGGSPGFTASVTVTNTGGSTISGWTAQWDYPAGQTATPPGWNATVTQSGATVTAENASWSGTLAPNQSASFGFNGTAATAGNNPSPTVFTLNGTGCAVS
jgi:endo-1,4-beta-xylanase